MDKHNKLNRMLIVNIASIGLAAYFMSKLGNPDITGYFDMTVALTISMWLIGVGVYWGINYFKKDSKMRESTSNILNTGAITMAFMGVSFYLLWLGAVASYGPNMSAEVATAYFNVQMPLAGASMFLITTVTTVTFAVLSELRKVRFEGTNYTYSRNLALSLLGMFTLFTTQAHFAPGVFGLVNTTTGWTGLIGGWAAHLLMGLIFVTVLGAFGAYGYFMVKKPEIKQAGERPAFVTTFVTLIAVSLTFYMFDTYVIKKLYPEMAMFSQMEIPLTGGPNNGLEIIIELPIDVITQPGEGVIIGTPNALGYHATMFALSTVAGVAIVNVPFMYWQKKVLHAHKNK